MRICAVTGDQRSLVGETRVRTIDGTCESALEGKGAPMTLLPTSVFSLPPGELDENRAIDIVGEQFSMAPHGMRLDKEYSRELLQTELEEGLREGGYELAICAIKAADAGNEIADAALRTIAREILGDALPERKPGHVQVRAYGQRALDQPPHKRPRGRNRYDNLVRDIHICLFIILACREFGVQPTRNRIARRANRAPSGISLVVKALARHRNLHLDEASVQENLWNGLPGALARRHAPASLWPR